MSRATSIAAAAMLIATIARSAAASKPASSPLESMRIEGTPVSREVILEMAGWHIGQSVNQAVIEEGCKRLQASGLFSSIVFRYAPGPKFGYALTLTLTDQSSFSDARIDVPGIDDTEIWQWLMSRYPHFRRRVPGAGTAHDYLARQIEQHLGAKLEGQHLAPRLEMDPVRKRLIVSFRPEVATPQ